MTPYEQIIQSLWNNQRVMLRGPEFFREYMLGLAVLHGLTDSLTLGFVVYKHNDPDCPGELRVRLAQDGLVLIHYFFREAPGAKLVVEVPIAQYREGYERTVNAEHVIGGLVNMLLANGLQRNKEESTSPKLLLPETQS